MLYEKHKSIILHTLHLYPPKLFLEFSKVYSQKIIHKVQF